MEKRNKDSIKETIIESFENTKEVFKRIENGEDIKPLVHDEELCTNIKGKEGTFISKGSSGKVTTLKLDFKVPVILKKTIKRQAFYPGSEIYTETVIGSVFNVDGNIHFQNLISSFICKNHGYSISEKLDGHIDEFHKVVGRNIAPKDVRNFLFQVFAALDYSQKKYKFIHRDLHPGNFMLKKIEKDKKKFTYEIEGKQYSIPNRGFIVKIIDFGYGSIEFNDKIYVQKMIKNKKANGFDKLGNFTEKFEASLDPIFFITSLQFDPLVNLVTPVVTKNLVFKRILKGIIKSGYVSAKNVDKIKPDNKLWTLTNSTELRRPYGNLPNDKLSPGKIIETYFKNYLV